MTRHASAILLVRHNSGVPCTIESISLGGMRLVGPLTLSVGEKVQVLLDLDGTPLDIEGEAIHVVRHDVTTDRAAIAFRNLSASTRLVIRELVARSWPIEGDTIGEL